MGAPTDPPASGARRGSARLPLPIIGGLIAGTLACAALILTQEGNPKYVFITFVVMIALVLLPLVGNLRLVALYCLLFLAPIGLRMTFAAYPHMGGAGAIFFEATDPFIAILLYFQLRDRIRGFRHEYHFPLALVLWAALIVNGLGWVVFGTMRTIAVLEVVRMLKLLLLALVVVNELLTRKHFQHATAALIVGVIAQAALSLTQTFAGEQLGLQFLGEATDEEIKLLGSTSLESGEFVYRAGALLGHANLLAAYLALFLPTGIALLLTRAPRLLKFLAFVMLAVGLPSLVLTLSRTGWLAFLAALAIVITMGASHPTSRRKYILARLGIVAAVVVVGLATSPLIIKRIEEADPNSFKYRLEWLKVARGMIEDNPVWGVGLNTYVFKQLPYGDYKTPAEMTAFYGDIWPVVHNSWMITWSEQGTVGMLLWVAFHISVIMAAWRNLRIRDPMLHALSVGLLGGFVAIMVDGMASFFVKQESPARMFWIAAAMILAIEVWRRANEEVKPAIVSAPAQPESALPALQPVLARARWLPARSSPLR